ncbi:hypothetical protein FIBSPDRAFT_884653 [Athelia psychrophila]|uniref:Uncharacterized protein n=1 Tax=Athelia psychrophila TaxID=1759441 RepID=A0A166SZA0_9AGAM|nr:hypothetical protein FIBSPDRAFT_884653 [Fibularhizoctonia sp. CBS 109695]
MSSPPQFYVDEHTYLLEEQSREDEGKKCFIVHVDQIHGIGSTIAVLLDNNWRRDQGVTFDLQRNQVCPQLRASHTVRPSRLPMQRRWATCTEPARPRLPDGAVKVTCDYDSILGISNDLLYMSALAVYPLPLFKETLKKNNHMTSLVFDSPLYSSDENAVVPISTELLGCIYYEALKPAVDEIILHTKGQWPITYNSTMMGACNKRTGQLHFGSINIDAPWLE